MMYNKKKNINEAMNNTMIQKILMSALLLTTFNDFIQGSITDILAPIYNAILPGDIKKPVNIFGIKFYFTRFLIRCINVYVALLLVLKITTGRFVFNPLKRNESF
tara:strand:+ start:12916 stop:13230 length:315 start_codon:yes stop_codon:yes gene_type:complete